MSANGISDAGRKKDVKQADKLTIARAKKQGRTVARDGTISGAADTTVNWFRTNNTANVYQLPTRYVGNAVVVNDNSATTIKGNAIAASSTANQPEGTLQPGRPWFQSRTYTLRVALSVPINSYVTQMYVNNGENHYANGVCLASTTSSTSVTIGFMAGMQQFQESATIGAVGNLNIGGQITTSQPTTSSIAYPTPAIP
jgi:hypothetical protein